MNRDASGFKQRHPRTVRPKGRDRTAGRRCLKPVGSSEPGHYAGRLGAWSKLTPAPRSPEDRAERAAQDGTAHTGTDRAGGALCRGIEEAGMASTARAGRPEEDLRQPAV